LTQESSMTSSESASTVSKVHISSNLGKSDQRPTLANIKRDLKELVRQEGVDVENAGIRTSSYGLASPNRNMNHGLGNSGTVNLDSHVSEEGKGVEEAQEPANANFFHVYQPNALKGNVDIVYNEADNSDPTDKKAKFRCVNVHKGAHDGKVNSILVLDSGILVTGGSDKRIKFWDPINNELIAEVNEGGEIGNLVKFPKIDLIYYSVGSKVK
jgi:hypothetical protein